jgi:methionyl-tRNA formyltransferase
MTMAIAESVEHDPKRVVLFGMECAFTASFLESLLASRVANIVAIVLARTAKAVPATGLSWPRQSKYLDNLTVIELSRRSELTSRRLLGNLAALDVDVIVVACFPWRLPAAVRLLPGIASVNVHPSRLPDGRGPEPIFWAFRRDLDSTGVTLHAIDDGLDTGPVIDQRTEAIPFDATMITLERSLAHIGADMFSDFLSAPLHADTMRPQPTNEGRPAPFPEAEDLIVTTLWPAAKAARFINGVSPIYGSIEVLILANGQRLAVAGVLEIENSTSATTAVRLQEDEAWIQFPDGLLHCRLQLVHQRLAFAI